MTNWHAWKSPYYLNLVKRVGNGVEAGAGMKFLNHMQQFRAHTGGYKALAVPAGGLHQLGMLRSHAASERASNQGLVLLDRGSLHEPNHVT